MARQTGWALAALIVIGGSAAAPLSATHDLTKQKQQKTQQSDGRRDGHDRNPPWWKAPKTVAELELTPQQSDMIDQVFREYREAAIPLREQLERLEKALDRTMRASTADISVVAQQVDEIETRRAQLNKMRTLMLYRMRRVLTAEQNTKFQAMVDRRDAERRRQDGRR